MYKHVLSVAVAAMMCTTAAWGQMTFTFADGAKATYSTMADGAQMVELPADGNGLTGIITGVQVDGKEINAADVKPNPTTTLINEDEIETFVYGGKAYSFRFSRGRYFTVVIFSDPHVDQTDYYGNTEAQFTTFVNDIVNMGKANGKQFRFDKAPAGYVPTPDLVLCLGDMDKDSQKESYSSGKNTYYNVTKAFNDNGIPFVDMVGNHDVVPDYWGSGTEKALSFGVNDGGSYCNDVAFAISKQHRTQAAALQGGITDVTEITDGTRHTQAPPFTFLFEGVRFYVGQAYWFQKPYDKPSLISSAKYYAPDGVVAALDRYATAHADEASVWVQHYPLAQGSDCNRWWLDQNAGGNYIAPSNSTVYPYSSTLDDAKAADLRKTEYTNIVKKTKNPVHFSGHYHRTATASYNGVTDYTIGAPGAEGYIGHAYIVLCKGGSGVKEVKQVVFNR